MSTDQLLNVAARILLRTLPPVRAHSILKRLGSLLPQRQSRLELARAAESLGTAGSCLSRALALAQTVYLLHQGEIVYAGPAADLDEERIFALYTGANA